MQLLPMNEQQIRCWYRTLLPECFAPNEIKPEADIARLLAEDRYEVWGLFEDGPADSDQIPIGFACIWKRKGIPLVLLDYLGVTAAARNGGYGAWMLEQLKKQGRPMVCESELPVDGDPDEENAIRRRRIAFYERNGFRPAYEMATCGLRWQALLIGDEAQDIKDVMRWHKQLYDEDRTDVKVPLAPGEKPQPPYWLASVDASY